jgi:hypothetical protein
MDAIGIEGMKGIEGIRGPIDFRRVRVKGSVSPSEVDIKAMRRSRPGLRGWWTSFIVLCLLCLWKAEEGGEGDSSGGEGFKERVPLRDW